MIDRKRKLRLIQFFLLVVGISIIYFAYYNVEEDKSLKIISETTSKKLEKQNKEESLNDGDVFFDVEYTGLDLNGNRYILKSKEAYLDQDKTEIIYMKTVAATFYFKDDTVLYVWSNKGIYNNKTLDMKFDENVKANYFDSELFADKAEYSNSKSYLSIYENVKINDKRGDLIADKLLFDITKQKLNITSFNNGKINANVKLNEKRF